MLPEVYSINSISSLSMGSGGQLVDSFAIAYGVSDYSGLTCSMKDMSIVGGGVSVIS